MPTIFTHGIAALAIASPFCFRKNLSLIWLLGILCSILPDLDVIGFALGIRYGDLIGHRGFTHSLFFAVFVSLFVTFVILRDKKWDEMRYRLILYFFIVTASHGILDAMTNGGLGIAFFSPFDPTRYFLPFRPIKVSPIGIDFFSARGFDVILTEAEWIWLPSLLLVGLFYISCKTGSEVE